MTGRIVIVSGPPGAGKSTVARKLASGVDGPLAVHLHTDDFYAYIRKGYVEPWTPESQAQNIAVMKALASAAAEYARAGYEALVDGIVGPWFFAPWLDVARTHALDLRFIVLRPSEAETVARGTAREGHPMRDPEVIRFMWTQFADMGPHEPHAFDSSGQTAEATAAELKRRLAAGEFRLP